MALLGIAVGLIALVAGGELLVRGAASLALAAKIRPIVVGLTVVAFGTSAPELAVSVSSAWAGKADLALGNVVGSNIANILLILGASALLAPLDVASRIVRVDVPLMVLASLAVWAMAVDLSIGRWDGIVLATCVIVYTVWLVRASRYESAEVEAEFVHPFPAEEPTDAPAPGRTVVHGVTMAVGLVLLVLGSRWMVDGASSIARAWGVSERVIGLTIVAVGTSLPELMTSAVASLRGERDLAVGNVVGSNLFNLWSVLGFTAALSPSPLVMDARTPEVDLPVMTGISVLCIPLFWTGKRVSRVEGALLLACYVAYLSWLVAFR